MRLALVLAALALAAPAARAQDAAPVVGGGSFNDAPVLEPGRYRDTIITREQLFYAVELAAGDQLRLGVELVDVEQERFRNATSAINVHVFSPLRRRDHKGPARDLAGHGTSMFAAGRPVGLLTQAVDPFADAIDETSYRGPGTWYVALESIWGRSRSEPPRIELPFELELAIESNPVTEQPDPTVAPATPTATASAPGSGAEGGGDDGPAAAAVGGIGIAGLALGGLLGVLAGRRRRP